MELKVKCGKIQRVSKILPTARLSDLFSDCSQLISDSQSGTFHLRYFLVIPPNTPLLIPAAQMLDKSALLCDVLAPFAAALGIRTFDSGAIVVIAIEAQQQSLQTFHYFERLCPQPEPTAKEPVPLPTNSFYCSAASEASDTGEGLSVPSSITDETEILDGEDIPFDVLLQDPTRFDQSSAAHLPRSLLRVPSCQIVPVTAESLARLGLGHLSLHRIH